MRPIFADKRVRPRFPRSTHLHVSESADIKKRADVILQRLAWISQIVLVLAGIAGYIFTVRPVYQKQLLDEQIAERNISLKEATESLAKLRADEARLKGENAQLGTEAKTVYGQLLDNLALELFSIPNACISRKFTDADASLEVYRCAEKFVRERIFRGLKPQDQAILQKIVQEYRDRIVSGDSDVIKKFLSKSRQIDRDIKRNKEELQRAEPDVRDEIYRLRVARAKGAAVEPDPPTGRIIVRAREDEEAYQRFSERHSRLVSEEIRLINEKSFFDVDVDIARSDALRKIASRMHEDFRRKAKGR